MRNLLSGQFGAALFWAGLMVPASGLAAELSVEVVGADSDKGQIHFGLYNDPATFPDREARIGGREKTIEKGRAMVVFKGLTPGFYAVAVFHDENGNGAFDQGLFGFPLEDFAFSNEAVAFLGAPSFERARFQVPETGARITIDLD